MPLTPEHASFPITIYNGYDFIFIGTGVYVRTWNGTDWKKEWELPESIQSLASTPQGLEVRLKPSGDTYLIVGGCAVSSMYLLFLRRGPKQYISDRDLLNALSNTGVFVPSNTIDKIVSSLNQTLQGKL